MMNELQRARLYKEATTLLARVNELLDKARKAHESKELAQQKKAA